MRYPDYPDAASDRAGSGANGLTDEARRTVPGTAHPHSCCDGTGFRNALVRFACRRVVPLTAAAGRYYSRTTVSQPKVMLMVPPAATMLQACSQSNTSVGAFGSS